MDAHANEYAAAAAAIADQTPSGCRLPAVGDYVHGQTCGRQWCGYVQSIEPRRAVIEIDGAWIAVHPRDITSVGGDSPGWVECS